MVEIVAYTAFDTAGFNKATDNALANVTHLNHYKPKSVLAFAKYWQTKGVDPTTLMHVGVVTSFPSQWLQDYGVSVHKISTSLSYLYASFVFWKIAAQKEPTKEPINQIIKKFKGLDLYALLD